MAWKNLKQYRLADSLMIDHDAIKVFGSAYSAIGWSRLGALLQHIYSSKRGDRVWLPHDF